MGELWDGELWDEEFNICKHFLYWQSLKKHMFENYKWSSTGKYIEQKVAKGF